MTTQEKLTKIDKTIVEKQNCRVHFIEKIYRLPITGMFINHLDTVELRSKGMIRFVSTGKANNYNNTKSVYFTRILAIEDIQDIKPFVCPVIV